MDMNLSNREFGLLHPLAENDVLFNHWTVVQIYQDLYCATLQLFNRLKRESIAFTVHLSTGRCTALCETEFFEIDMRVPHMHPDEGQINLLCGLVARLVQRYEKTADHAVLHRMQLQAANNPGACVSGLPDEFLSVTDIKRSEFHALVAGIKPCCRWECDSLQADAIEDLFLRIGIRSVRGAAVGGCRVMLYASRDMNTALMCRDIELNQAKYPSREFKRIMGKILGYPKCCIEAFLDLRFTKGSSKEITEHYLRLTRGDRNIRDCGFAHHFFALRSCLSPVHHYPCAMDCRKSVSYAQRLIAYLADRDPILASGMEHILRRDFLFFPDGGALFFSRLSKEQGSVVLYDIAADYELFPAFFSSGIIDGILQKILSGRSGTLNLRLSEHGFEIISEDGLKESYDNAVYFPHKTYPVLCRMTG